MGEPRLSKVGSSKLVTAKNHAIHVPVPTSAYRSFRQWCYDHGTTPTEMTRELVLHFIEADDLQRYELVLRRKEKK